MNIFQNMNVWEAVRRAARAAVFSLLLLPAFGAELRAAEIKRIRLTTQGEWTRFILDLSGPAEYILEQKTGDTYIRLMLPSVSIGNAQRSRRGLQLIDSYILQDDRGSAVLTVRVTAPVRVVQEQTLGPSGNRGHRIVIDLDQTGGRTGATTTTAPREEDGFGAPEPDPAMPDPVEDSGTVVADDPLTTEDLPQPVDTPARVLALLDTIDPQRKPPEIGGPTTAPGIPSTPPAETPSVPQPTTPSGTGVPADPEIQALKQRADRGDAKAMYEMADYYFVESRVEPIQKSRYEAEAIRYYRAASELGYPPAQSKLGYLYSTGQGVIKDMQQAIKWYLQAAQGGDTLAQYNLGQIYRTGLGVERDYRAAARWYGRAAESGNAKAQYTLGLMYYRGMGVEQDSAMGKKFIDMAASQGLAEAIRIQEDPDKALE